MRVWIDLTNSPHVLVMRPVIERLRRRRRRRAGDGARLRADGRPVRAPRHRRARSIGRHRGGRVGAKALGLADRSLALRRWARGSRRRPRARPRLQRRHRRRSHAADSQRHDVRLRVGDRPAQRQLPPRADRGRSRGDPAGAAASLRRDAARSAPMPGLKEEYYLADLEPDPAVLVELGLDRGGADRGRAHAARSSRSTTASSTTSSDRSSRVCAEQGQVVVLPRTAEQRLELAGDRRLHRARAGDRRTVAGRAAPTWS